MTPASLLPLQPGDFVLDLCAAPGGKATELGARLQGKGLLVANDISASRARALLRKLELCGIENALVTKETPVRLAGFFPEFFDKILVDAPCSGEGMFRKDSDVAKAWDKDKPAYFAKLQREILDRDVYKRQAVKYGYSSPTSFNRAFQKVHGIRPMTAKNMGCTLCAYPALKFSVQVSGDAPISYHSEEKDLIRIVGFKTPLVENMEANMKHIPLFWKQAWSQNQIGKLAKLSDGNPDGILGVRIYSGPQNFYYYIAVSPDAPALSLIHIFCPFSTLSSVGVRPVRRLKVTQQKCIFSRSDRLAPCTLKVPSVKADCLQTFLKHNHNIAYCQLISIVFY